MSLQAFMTTQPRSTVCPMGLRATIRPHRGEPVTLGFKGTSLSEVHARVMCAAGVKFPHGFTYSIREA